MVAYHSGKSAKVAPPAVSSHTSLPSQTGPMLLILLALIVRVVAFEWRGKIDDDRWRRRADRALIVGSWVPAVLWGVAFGNLVRGVHLGPDHQYVGTFFDLLNPFALLGGATTAM